MELTYRQKSFLRMLLELYREARQPLHYTQVAQRLGLGKSSAYDMLRLLERKGLVMSDYVLPKESSSPGRSQVRFWPTARAKKIISMLTSDVEEDGEEWQRVKARILNRLRFGKASSRERVMREVTKMIPKAQSPLAVCVEVVTMLLLSVKKVQYNLGPQSILAKVLAAPPSKLGMSLSAGLAAGMVHMDAASRQIIDHLDEYAKRYETSLQELSAKNVEDLHEYTQDVISILHRHNK